MLKLRLYVYYTFLLGVLSYFCTGCAIKNHEISFGKVDWQTPHTYEIHDKRDTKDLGHTTTLLGMKLGRLISKKAVTDIILFAVEKAVLMEKIPSIDSHVCIFLNRCDVEEVKAFLYKKATAHIELTIHVTNKEHLTLYFKKYSAEGIQAPILFYTEKNISKALNKALENIISTLSSDKELFHSLNHIFMGI